MSLEHFELHGNPDYTFSYCVRAGDLLYTAHHGAWTYEGAPSELDINEQTEYTFRNLEKTLAAAGASLDDIAQTTVYLRSKEDFKGMKDATRGIFKKYPARMTVFTDFLNDTCLIMIEAVAYKLKN